jgi:hypothetical protein
LIVEHEAIGLWVVVKDRHKPPAGAAKLLKALSAAGLSAALGEAPIDEGTFDLLVGLQAP